MDKFRGLFPAAITPMAGDGEGFDEVAFRKVLEERRRRERQEAVAAGDA